MLRIAIVEDRPESAEQLEEFVGRFFREKQLPWEVVQFSDGSALVRNYQPQYDLIFLDIEMKPMDGMQTAREIRKTDSKTVIVFVTRMAQYAVKGYEVGALDFLVKPLEYQRFAFKMERVLTCLEQHREVRLMFRENGTLRVLSSADIDYVEVLNHDLIFHTNTGCCTTRGSLSELEKKLRSAGFQRCYKSYLINLSRITAVQSNSICVGGDTIPLSRSMRKEILQALAEYYGGQR